MDTELLTIIGTVTVLLAWLYQLACVLGGSTRVQTPFVAVYAAGVSFLVASQILATGSVDISAIINSIALTIVVCTLSLLLKKQSSKHS
jgi:hypothetical protein